MTMMNDPNAPDADGLPDLAEQRRRDRHQPEYTIPSVPFPDDFRGVDASKPIPEERGRVLR